MHQKVGNIQQKLHKDDKAKKIGSDDWYVMRFVVETAIQTLRRVCWGVKYGENYGIGFNDTTDILLDMQKVMEHALWLEEAPEKRSNWTNDAFEHTSPVGDEKNIRVKKI